MSGGNVSMANPLLREERVQTEKEKSAKKIGFGGICGTEREVDLK